MKVTIHLHSRIMVRLKKRISSYIFRQKYNFLSLIILWIMRVHILKDKFITQK